MNLTRVATSMIALTALGPGGFAQNLEAKLYESVSVKDFGAIANGSPHPLSERYATLAAAQAVYPFATALTDQIDWAAWQATANYAVAHGTSIRVPAGGYVVNKTITIDTSASTSQFSLRPDIICDGANTTSILWTGGNAVCLWFKGPEAHWPDGALHAYSVFSGLRIGNGGTAGEGIAIRVDNYAFWQVNNVIVADGFADCIYGTDVLSSAFYSCVFRGGKRGMTFLRNATADTDTNGDGTISNDERDFESGPNNLNLYSCTFGNLSEFAIWQVGGANFNMYGGSVEGIGLGGSGTRWGIKIDKAGREGAVGINLDGVYFENNIGVADVWIDQPDAVTGDLNFGGTGVSYNFKGVNFHRIGEGTNCTVNNIRIDTAALPFALGVYGCGFRGVAPYVASDARPCIQIHPNAVRGWSASIDPGNFFSHDVDRPPYARTPTFSAFLEANQSVSNNTATRVQFGAVENYGSCFVSGNNGFTAPYRVRMAFDAQVNFTGLAADTYVAVEIRVNGNLARGTSAYVTGGNPVNLSADLNLNRDDIVTVWTLVNNSDAGAKTIYSGQTNTWFTGRPA